MHFVFKPFFPLEPKVDYSHVAIDRSKFLESSCHEWILNFVKHITDTIMSWIIDF